jgi:dTDP-glucose 4,6-dehydratase
MKALITGGAGVLGSTLTKLLLRMGHQVTVLDSCRKEEAWRLFEDVGSINYIWKSEQDITVTDLYNYDIIFDCAIGFADRPFGSESPQNTTSSNIFPSLSLLEKVRRLERRPLVVYPSSFNALYGLGDNVTITEEALPSPTSIYGWTKAAVELLYRTYYYAYGIPVVITRTSFTFGPGGRSDELPHKLILSILDHQRSFPLRSPQAKRLWTFSKDVSSFYEAFIAKFEEEAHIFPGKILHLGGNKDDRITTNIELANLISYIADSDTDIIEDEYEAGEVVNGKPVTFVQNAVETREFLNWKPNYSLENSLKETIEWFKDHKFRYNSTASNMSKKPARLGRITGK